MSVSPNQKNKNMLTNLTSWLCVCVWGGTHLCSERFPRASKSTRIISSLSQKLPVTCFEVFVMERINLSLWGHWVWSENLVFAVNLLCCVRQKMSRFWSFILPFVELKIWIRREFLNSVGWPHFRGSMSSLKLYGKFCVYLCKHLSTRRPTTFIRFVRFCDSPQKVKTKNSIMIIWHNKWISCCKTSIFWWQQNYSTWHAMEFS